ncbi:VOC family protein [Streptomyces nodosus]|uniref:VOC family protein n=2 Tax=Streptomyces nodosus TaxID=40318 RepID=A0A5P2VYW8_9ACTN|nr:VOC family protein [Streptomyces nodosus]
MPILHTFARFAVDDFNRSVSAFESLTASSALRFPYGDWQTALVGDILLVWIPSAQKPSYTVQAVCAVDDLEEILRTTKNHGATCITGPKDAPLGRNFIAQHADGMIIEYVQLRHEFAALLADHTTAVPARD